MGGAPWVLAVIVGAAVGALRWLGGDARQRMVATFGLLLVALGIAVPVVSAPAHAEYLLPGLGGALLLTSLAVLPGPKPALIRFGGLCCAVAALSGGADLAALTSGELWRAGREYSPLRLSHELALRSVRPADSPLWSELLELDGASRWVGLGTGGEPARCMEQPLRLSPAGLAELAQPRCMLWNQGEFAAWLADWQEEHGPVPAEGLRAAGMGLWVVCGREVACVRSAVSGADPRTEGLIVRGAMSAEVQLRRKLGP